MNEMMYLTDAIEFVQKRKRKGVICPCCDQFVKTYKRKFNSRMARTLILCWPAFRDNPGKFLDVPGFCTTKHNFIPGEHGKLVSWGLFEKKDSLRDDGSSRNGMYRITPMGKEFLHGHIQVPKYYYFFNNTALDYSDETIGIEEALGNGFNYRELMAA